MEFEGRQVYAGLKCDARKSNGDICGLEPRYRCEHGHVLCIVHSIRIIGRHVTSDRKCLLCMDAGSTSLAARI